ncbi:hypothetical protein ACWGQ5_32120, partial [Streptomyces sp. NPDC055722]
SGVHTTPDDHAVAVPVPSRVRDKIAKSDWSTSKQSGPYRHRRWSLRRPRRRDQHHALATSRSSSALPSRSTRRGRPQPFVIDEMTDLVRAVVLAEFEVITERGVNSFREYAFAVLMGAARVCALDQVIYRRSV